MQFQVTPAKAVPPLSVEAHAQARKIKDRFETNLKAIAESIAIDNSAEAVLVPHVNEALLVLKRAGLQGRKTSHFWSRQDFKVAVGTFIFGLGPTIAGISRDCLEADGGKIGDQPIGMWIFMIGIPFAMMLGGAIYAAYGWMQSPEHN